MLITGFALNTSNAREKIIDYASAFEGETHKLDAFNISLHIPNTFIQLPEQTNTTEFFKQVIYADNTRQNILSVSLLNWDKSLVDGFIAEQNSNKYTQQIINDNTFYIKKDPVSIDATFQIGDNYLLINYINISEKPSFEPYIDEFYNILASITIIKE